MKYSIVLSEDGKYILLKVVGTISRLQVIECFVEMHLLGAEKGIDRYLIDFTECRNTDTVLRNYTLAYEDMKDSRINPQARSALLVSSFDHSHDFLETLLTNSGVDIILFHDLEPALRYLSKD
jgi:hypothetical protein